MKIHTLKFQDQTDSGSLREDYEESITELAENLAICMAEVRKWDAFRKIAVNALGDGMRLLDIKEMKTEDFTFTIDDGGIEVKYDPFDEVVH